jgi:hypothetical protein
VLPGGSADVLGSSLVPIIVPIIVPIVTVVVCLAVPIIMVFYADSHPTWKSGRAATGPGRPGPAAAGTERPPGAAREPGEDIAAARAAEAATLPDCGQSGRNGLVSESRDHRRARESARM